MAKEQGSRDAEETVEVDTEVETQEETQEKTAEAGADMEAPEETEDAPVQEDGEAEPEKEDEKKEEKKDKKSRQLEELNDKMMRTMAEFENFRKRSEKEKAQMFEIGARSVIEKILPVMDNFERGLASMEETPENKAVLDGMQMIYKQLGVVFDELGVTAIEAVGKEFDPNLHNAVMAVEDDSMESNTVCEELQKGYMYKETVVRHSMVKVVS